MSDLEDRTAYDPQPVEARWSKEWVEAGVFGAGQNDGEPRSIVIPPPNVTGVLHIGHALDNTIQDIIARFQRMRGRDMLWLPGTDHAGIATQAVVERNLATEGLNREEMGREAFLERVWSWKAQSHGTITGQLQRLGCSLDWSRERFTLDENLSAAVREAFCRLYDEGLIYRGRRIIHWCPQDKTALSDEEVDHVERQSHLWHLRYPLEDGSGHVEVATTRPETMLGDTGVAVSPDDERYAGIIGKTVTLPLMDRPIPIVADERVDKSFGTGAVKVTPAHDPLDFELGETHGLEQIAVIGFDGRMTEEAGEYQGLSREECRKKVVADLEAQGLLVKTEDYTHSVGVCTRCDTLIEPLISSQWYLKMPPLARRAIEADASGEGPRWVPERWRKVYVDWLEKLGDWCISRQLWWGHRIPVWTCQSCGHQGAHRDDPAKCPSCGSAEYLQEEDVLDTWFSSGLWPFSTMGWPDEDAPDLKRYFPTTVLVTGYDIIFFWVVRMATMSLKMTGRVPFETVFIHGLVRDEHGRKMSKSLGNAVDPIEVMDEYGTDALRFALTSLVTGGQDISFTPSRLVGARNFGNKIFNATRFALLNMEGFEPSAHEAATDSDRDVERWILSRTARAIDAVTSALEDYRFADAADAAYHWWWNEFCDWYVEMAKPALYGDDEEQKTRTRQVLHTVLSTGLRMLHPITPYITEELWHLLPGTEGYIGLQGWPERRPGWIDGDIEDRIGIFQEVTTTLRQLRAEKGVAPSKKVKIAVRPGDPSQAPSIEAARPLFEQLANVEELTVLGGGDPKPSDTIAIVGSGGSEIYLYTEGVVDMAQERARLEKELAETTKRLENTRKKLANENFTSKAPEDVVERERRNETELAEKVLGLERALSEIA
ncbi:MAG: valine--tRNA ligase [Armatimonadia bacterium]|nr:valine--tRNA ligase [Armatimonadia bacterium]